jgi:hypothetical protein
VELLGPQYDKFGVGGYGLGDLGQLFAQIRMGACKNGGEITLLQLPALSLPILCGDDRQPFGGLGKFGEAFPVEVVDGRGVCGQRRWSRVRAPQARRR